MEKTGESGHRGSKHVNLNKSFRQCVHSLLTAFPYEDFSKAFVRFTAPEQECLYQLYIQVITSLHENMQDEFDSLCCETQVGSILDRVEHLVEEQSLDPLFSQKSNLGQLRSDLLATKKSEIHVLEGLLEKVEDHKHSTKACIKLLKKKSEDTSVPSGAAEKLRSLIKNYGSYNEQGAQDSHHL